MPVIGPTPTGELSPILITKKFELEENYGN
nr:MAG TPA: hypothetical protein [Caudoviricetes sp.]